MKQNFIIFSSQRSGSSYLMRALDNHPEVLCAGGVFRKSKSKRLKYPELSFNYAEKKKNKFFSVLPKYFVKKHMEALYSFSEKEIRGFKLMTNHAEDLPSVLTVAKSMEVKAIVLKRKNIVRQAISLTIAQNAGLWIKPKKGSGMNYQIQIDIQRLVKNIKYFQRSKTLLENSEFATDPLVIYFEDLVGDNSAEVIEKVYSYLGVQEKHQSKVEEIKKSKFSLEERIQNYSEVIALLNDNNLAGYITNE
ncbi:MAG: LPS sulfotransferase NodH [Patiriisocius sp.]|jgi:LPS sulfotransferase NodH